MYFVGVDLAWSDNNQSGIVVLKDDELALVGVVKTDEEIIRAVTGVVGRASCLVAIDAPLVVPNESGSRLAEKEVNAAFRSYEAGAHPANRSWLTRSSGRVRGEDLVEQFAQVGIKHDPTSTGKKMRACFEVYPHPATVVLFGLEKTLKYKPRQNRSYEERWVAFEEYQKHLRALPLRGVADLLSRDVRQLRASALKAYEDRLDALLCAYVAYYAHRFPDRMGLYGSLEEGYILTPKHHLLEEFVR